MENCMAKATPHVVEAGSWVEIHCVVLAPSERASQCPLDTQQVPLEMTVKGFLSVSATVGDEVEIVTVAGRHLRGILIQENPGYLHTFGPPIPELLSIGGEVSALLRERRQQR
jgi:hypothetical protein